VRNLSFFAAASKTKRKRSDDDYCAFFHKSKILPAVYPRRAAFRGIMRADVFTAVKGPPDA